MNSLRLSFYRVCGLILLATAFAKIFSAFGRAKILFTPDPVFYVSQRIVLAEAGVLEFAIGMLLLFWKCEQDKWKMLTLLCVCFWTYRVAVLISGAGGPCPCLGNVFDWSPWLRDHSQGLILAVLILMSLGVLVFNPLRNPSFKKTI
jgi:hypothetical protein